eukprot:CAMPEP_0172011884 /NCGR_PEP_ID=MMETSP1041-20130122/8531_1 /TAXON_ID=464988 /ORGANISM="Hemiselmis andersenii, Strain CCMP439" /LENGTH=75 /DNA_ID=CAMNT_0012666401 /DNA_START=109 /DNA_END=333 /DNA_ORIENTATION=-
MCCLSPVPMCVTCCWFEASTESQSSPSAAKTSLSLSGWASTSYTPSLSSSVCCTVGNKHENMGVYALSGRENPSA